MLSRFIISQGHSFYVIFFSFSFIVGFVLWGTFFWLRFYVDGILGPVVWGLLGFFKFGVFSINTEE